jgi:betaine-aldehyde dehydrogenase
MTTIISTAPPAINANIWPNIIDGREVVGGGSEVLRDSPAHDVRVASYRNASEADVDAAVKAAHKAFSGGDWPQTSGAERAALLRRVATRIEAELDELALIETLESGKPISQARDEVSSAAGIWYYAASLAQHAYGDAHNDLGPNYLAVTVKEPIGVVGVITPWNFRKVPQSRLAGVGSTRSADGTTRLPCS